MKALFSLLPLLFLLNTNLPGQETRDSASRYDIHIMPLAILDYSPRYRIGFEYHTNNHLAYILDLGYGNSAISGFLNLGYIGDEYSLFEFRPELRYYYGLPLSNMYPFVSVEIFSIFMTNVFYDDYFHQENSPMVMHFSQATMRKIKSGFHIKTGLKIYASSKISVDLYLGIGAALRKFDYVDVLNPVEGEDDYWYEWFLPVYKFQGQKTIFHTTFGVKYGYYWD